MTDAIHNATKPTTELSFKDRSRPLVMTYAEKLFETLKGKEGDSIAEVVKTLEGIRSIFENTRASEIDTLWSEVERKYNDRRPLSTKAKTDEAKSQVLFSLYYEAVNMVDVTQLSTSDLSMVKDSFEKMEKYITMKYRPYMTDKDKRVHDNIVTITDDRIAAVTERFNTLVDEGKIAGRKL